ncbi:F-actin-capping protein subunit alpha [Coelomomyces lativittatus]|nr:F-actin-capping protein subunit alpha [Coelomomyces lativittatus]
MKLDDPKSFQFSGNSGLLDELIQSVNRYVEEHYPKGFGSVLPIDSDSYEIVIVASKYYPSNFCNARLLSRWKWNPSTSQLRGEWNAIIHFYEDGNVQLNLSHNFDLSVNSKASVSQVFKEISTAENQCQSNINKFYSEMEQTSFRNLRRALPVTKSKMDWHKIGTYKISSSLANK